MKFKKYIFIVKRMRYVFIATVIILIIYCLYGSVFFDSNKLVKMLPYLALIMALVLLLSCITDGILLPFIEYLEKKHKKGGEIEIKQ